MINIDSASGYIDIPKVNTYEELMSKLKQILQVNDELFQHLYFSYIDEEEQERTRLIPQIYDDFISQEYPKLSIGFLDNLNQEILDQFNDIIEANKKRFKDPEFLNELLAQPDSDKEELILEEAKPEFKEEDVKEEVKEEEKEEDKEEVIQEIKVEEIKEEPIEEIKEIEIENMEKNDETKSVILAPYNSYIYEKENQSLDSDIKIENNILEYDSKAQPMNKIYELNNNNTYDHGTIKENDDKSNNNNIIIIVNDNAGNNQERVSNQQNNIVNDENLVIKKEDSSDNFCLFGPDSKSNDNVISIENKNNEGKNDKNEIFNSELNLKCFNDEFSNQINALEESMKHSNIEEYQKNNEENNFENNVKKIIEENVDNAKKDILNSILLETSKIVSQSKINQKKSKNNYRHEGIKCNICGMFPIVGIRYKCLECDNYNCCENCEQKQNHPHLFYKIKNNKALRN